MLTIGFFQWCYMEACEIIRKAANLESKFRKDIKGLSSVIGASLAIYAIEGGVHTGKTLGTRFTVVC